MITKLSFLLVIISSLIHPLWNLLLKRSDDKVIFYLNIHLIYTLMFCFVLILYPIKGVSLEGWIFIMLSALAHFFYQMFLCRTYELGDLSLTYPIVRSAPIFVLLMGLVFLKEAPSLLASIGIFMVILGMQIINLKRLSLKIFFTPFKHLEKGAISFAVLTAFSSACYSVVDKKGALAMHPVLFFYLFFSISGFLFLGYLFFLDVKRRRRYFEILKKDKLSIAIAALLEFSSYILILYAFCISKVAYVIALRQISVVFGVLFGILFLKEGYGKPRIVGSIVISLGVFLISAFG